MPKFFHASVEGAQHGAKGLEGFLDFAKKHNAGGAQPTNFMLESPNGGFLPPNVIRRMFGDRGLHLDGVSAHCPFWVQTTAWTGSPTIRPFLPAFMKRESPENIENWAVDYLLRLMDLCAELGVHTIPMFWGVAFGWEVATGYPWGFWNVPGDYDLIHEGAERFIHKTHRLRERARELHISLAHEIHPGTAAQCADDFLFLVQACGEDPCLGVNADPSHCWEGESWQDRFTKVGDRITGCHMKSHIIKPGLPLRCMISNWPDRPMQFGQLGRGPIDLIAYVERMINAGYPNRYCRANKTATAPLVVEAEGAYEDLDAVSANGISYTQNNCCFEIATGSFEDGMGA